MEELYSTDESEYENNNIDNFQNMKKDFINFSCGDDYCIVKFDDRKIIFQENYFSL
jgi:hypothetical protein